jgi:hypothetical protein
MAVLCLDITQDLLFIDTLLMGGLAGLLFGFMEGR